MKDKILIHCCCAPCASYPLQKLQQDGFEPIIYFYNPNIYPVEEYNIRKNELKNYAGELGIVFIDEDYENEIFSQNIKGYENEPEKGARCSICFYLRLDKTAKKALELNIKYFTTTLSVSPHKNSAQIFEQGRKVQQKMAEKLYDVEFLEYNFKKQDGFKISRQIANQNNMYAQKYCGCKYSMR